MIKTLRYDMRTAYESGYKKHPQLVMSNLGFKVLSYEGVPIGDCAIIKVDAKVYYPKKLPEFLTKADKL